MAFDTAQRMQKVCNSYIETNCHYKLLTLLIITVPMTDITNNNIAVQTEAKEATFPNSAVVFEL